MINLIPIQDELTYKVIGCAMEVHKILGNGFQEVIYQRCLALELQRANIKYEREVEQPIFYKEDHGGTRRADFIIEGKLVVELKAVIQLEDVHLSQAKNYLTAYNFDLGLLINFGSASMEYKRVFRSNKSSKSLSPESFHIDRKFSKSINPGHPDTDSGH